MARMQSPKPESFKKTHRKNIVLFIHHFIIVKNKIGYSAGVPYNSSNQMNTENADMDLPLLIEEDEFDILKGILSGDIRRRREQRKK